MKYIIANNDGENLEIEAITSDPLQYVSDFEPVDVLDGKMIAWDEDGNYYEFGPHKNLSDRKIFGAIRVVDVGKWQKGEPLLINVDNSPLRLQEELVKFLKSKKAAISEEQSLQDLIKDVEAEIETLREHS